MKKKVWLVRPLPHYGDHLETFLEKNIVAVGYPLERDLTDTNFETLRTLLNEKGWGEGISNVNILVNEMSIGDIVLVPSSNKKDIFFGEIKSDYMYVSSLDEDIPEISGYPHQRKVSWYFEKKPYLRNDLPEAIKGSLRYPRALADITKHYEFIEKIILGGPSQQISEIEKRALQVIEELLESTEESIRLKAAEIILAR
ncbi:hypothetical protein JMA_35730 [Jeotgalibacillus malaysiensis]|uniref:Uncharacterized protein n=1 Tax=Jeotgalibacillus malaysiensis TaxID=1508404 RepID=A0A0B5ARL0_9BACL|nr:hypothetical protein [Jeotgalibacillus malaysiensis]AJD92890.1 hypothetical protein JMA_35730 [Jeotgalibacillus malaysiensis]